MSYHNNDEQDTPFNDAIDHLQKIEGHAYRKGGKLPLPIKIIGYFMFVGLVLMVVFGLFANLLL